MANARHLALLRRGVTTWNRWRQRHPEIKPDLRKVSLDEQDLRGADLSRADLFEAYLYRTKLQHSNLSHASLRRTILMQANLRGAILARTDLREASLYQATLAKADLTRANCSYARFVQTKLPNATLVDCRVYGASVWDVDLTHTEQARLLITPQGKTPITVDDLEIAQFIALLLENRKIRRVIDTIGKKAVLILGRFTPSHKQVLDSVRAALQHEGYVPILFDWEHPTSRDFTETIATLAHLARFIIADLTEPHSLPKELEAIVPTLAVPVQPILQGAGRPYRLFADYWKYPWVLPAYRYEKREALLATLQTKVIAPAEAKAQELAERRAAALADERAEL